MTSHASVLIVEDSATQALRLRHLLEKQGFRGVTATDGIEALELLKRERPMLVVSDIQMPRMDGYELCRRMKAEEAWRDIPFILLTSFSSPLDVIHGLECGADNFVIKPYVDNFLLARIVNVLSNRALGDAGDDGKIGVHFGGRDFRIAAGRRQILSLLLSAYETALETNSQLAATNATLKAMQAQLVEAEKLQATGRLAAGVAHEVRNPLAIIEMGVAALSSQPPPGESQPILHEMHEAVRRANDVVSQLMDLSAPTRQGHREVRLHEVIDRALEVQSAELTEAGIRVVKRYSPALPSVRADPAKVTQLLINVIKNALQAMPAGGVLEIATRTGHGEAVEFNPGERAGERLRESGPAVFVEIADEGSGFPVPDMDKLFDPFFTTRPTGQGMGLGLTVAKKIMELHGGDLRVANRPQGGALVTLIFPQL